MITIDNAIAVLDMVEQAILRGDARSALDLLHGLMYEFQLAATLADVREQVEQTGQLPTHH